MLFENKEKLKTISKWIIVVFTICSLIYLGVAHLNIVASAITWIFQLFFPLILGSVFALIINVALRPIEGRLFQKTANPKCHKARRPLAILLSFLLIFGIFIGIAFLIIPELINAITIVVNSLNAGMDQMAVMNEKIDWSVIPFGAELSKIDIDWIAMKAQLQTWFTQISNTLLNTAMNSLSSFAGSLVDFIVALVFSIYILSNKEKLQKQILRLIHVWIPERFGNRMIHVFTVCGNTFHQFVIGQTTEAIILGSLCTLGMLILRLPYAPMIGSLVGATAVIPYVGAYLGAFVGAFMILTVNPLKALIFLIFLVILQQVEGNLIYPRVVGAKINLPSMWVLAAITVGGNLAGPIGMLLGVPAASAAYVLLREATDKREIKKLSPKNNL